MPTRKTLAYTNLGSFSSQFFPEIFVLNAHPVKVVIYKVRKSLTSGPSSKKTIQKFSYDIEAVLLLSSRWSNGALNRARNEIGETSCQLELVVIGEKTLYLDPHHPEGARRSRYFYL